MHPSLTDWSGDTPLYHSAGDSIVPGGGDEGDGGGGGRGEGEEGAGGGRGGQEIEVLMALWSANMPSLYTLLMLCYNC